VQFSPHGRGIQIANLTFISSANTSPDNVIFTGRGRFAADLRIQQDSIDFSQMVVGETREAHIAVVNDGYDTLRVVNLSTTNGVFSAAMSTPEIPPDSQATILVSFTPQRLGPVSASVVFRSNSVTSPDSIRVSGNATVHGAVRTVETSGGVYLSQNFPNPVRMSGGGTTGILLRVRFAIPSAGNVRFSIYNIAGQEVARVIDEELPRETFEITWSALHLASGVYFYRITSPGFVATRKMLIMK
jgi:hypothetical protein